MESPLSSVIFVLNLLSIVGVNQLTLMFYLSQNKEKNPEIINE